jgi:hypothetical protein
LNRHTGAPREVGSYPGARRGGSSYPGTPWGGSYPGHLEEVAAIRRHREVAAIWGTLRRWRLSGGTARR